MVTAGTAAASGRRAGRADLLAQVDAMVRREVLSPDSRSHALLLYLVEHLLANGPDEPVKAYAIAVDVLGRGADFDPAQDSIVRVEIGRLRKLLDMYALGPGQSDPLCLSLPRGQSHLAVIWAAAVAQAPPMPPAPPSRPWWMPWRRIAAFGLVAMLAIVLVARGLWPHGPSADITAALAEDYPRVFVRTLQKDGPTGTAYPESAMALFLADALSGWQSFRAIAPEPPTALPVRPRDYVLDGTAAVAEGEGLALSLRLRDGTGAVLWTDRMVLDDSGPGQAAKVYAALTEVAATLGGALGVIDSDGRARLTVAEQAWDADDGSAFRCFLRWQSFDLTKDPDEGAAARACLKRLAAADTPVGQIWAALAYQRYLDWAASGAGTDGPGLDAALAAASRAILIDPTGAEGHEAMGSILTGIGRTDEARAALERAMELNPSNLDTLVKLGWLDALVGDWDSGVAGIRAVADRYAVVPGWYRLPLALDALRRGDAAGLRAEAEAMVAAGDGRGRVLALAAAGLRGATDDATRLRAAIAAAGGTVAGAVDEIGAVFPDEALMAGLRAAVGG